MADQRFEPFAWMLGLYTLLAVLFWGLAFGPGGGGTSEIEVGWSAAAINFLLLVPIWRGHTWSIPLLALYTLGLAAIIGTAGLPPGGPWFGGLAGVAGVMFLLLCGMGYLRRETDDRSPTA